MVLLDLSAAFDTIDHQILLERMERSCGISGTARQWLASYLSDRTQTVTIGESRSDPIDLNIGVPQGSVMGPLMFTMYIRPIGAIIRRHNCGFHCYADDTQLYVRFSPHDPTSLLAAIRRLEACIEEIRRWMTHNKLKLNNGKTEFLVVVSRYYQDLVNEVQPVIRIGGSVIRPSKSIRNLGATFDTRMSMQPHVNNITRASYHHLRSLSRVRRHLDISTCTAAVRALILTRLDYANSLLANLPENCLNKLQLVQNNAARLATRTPRRAHITPVLKELHWLPVRQRVQHKVMTMTYRALHSKTAPSYLAELLLRPRHGRLLRSSISPKLLVPRTRKTVGDRAFSVFAPRHWNLLPSEVTSCTTYQAFKRSLKTFLFCGYFNN